MPFTARPSPLPSPSCRYPSRFLPSKTPNRTAPPPPCPVTSPPPPPFSTTVPPRPAPCLTRPNRRPPSSHRQPAQTLNAPPLRPVAQLNRRPTELTPRPTALLDRHTLLLTSQPALPSSQHAESPYLNHRRPATLAIATPPPIQLCPTHPIHCPSPQIDYRPHPSTPPPPATEPCRIPAPPLQRCTAPTPQRSPAPPCPTPSPPSPAQQPRQASRPHPHPVPARPDPLPPLPALQRPIVTPHLPTAAPPHPSPPGGPALHYIAARPCSAAAKSLPYPTAILPRPSLNPLMKADAREPLQWP